jgi:hypothetical protein
LTGSRAAPAPRQIPLAVAGVSLAALGRVLAEFPPVVEWHRTVLFPRLSAVLQGISGGAAETMGEVGVAALVVLAVAALATRRSRVGGALLFALGLGIFGFYASWGLAYRYAPLSARLAALTESDAGASAARLADLAGRSADLAARASQGPLSFGGTQREFLARVNAGIDAGFPRWPESIEASPVRAVNFGPAKASRVSFALSRLQISGYYFPWTGEAQIDADMPRSLWPRVSAHEKAHQRGFARENEATVIGLITCLSSPDPTVFYGGTLGLFVGFDRELARVDPGARSRVWAALAPRVAEDLRREAEFWKVHEGVAGAVGEKVNDTYLKAQGVKSGVGSYAETTRLILQAAETPGLELGPLLRGADAGTSPPIGSPEGGVR